MAVEQFTSYYLPKISSGISIFGSSVVLAEIWKDVRNTSSSDGSSGQRRSRISAVSRILVSVSAGDILFSFGWFLGTWVAPKTLDYLDGTNHGSYESCRFQGFVLQLGGLAALLFNASLAVLYLLMICYNWDELRLHQWGARLTIFVWALCLGVAIYPLPLDMYHNKGPICMVDSYPYGCTETWQLDDGMTTTDCTAGDNAGFSRKLVTLLSIWGAILCDSVIMCIIYGTVRNLEKDCPQQVTTMTSTQQHHSQIQSDPHLTTTMDEQLEVDTNLEDQDKCEEDSVSSNDDEPSRITSSPGRSNRKRGSRIVAREGLLYIAGFLFTFSLPTLNMVIFLVSGSWIGPLDRASYFFITLQGFWNFLIFSRKRDMKTVVGRHASRLLRCRPCTDASSDHTLSSKAPVNKNGKDHNMTSPATPARILSTGDTPMPLIAEDPPEQSKRKESYFVQWKNSLVGTSRASSVSDLGTSGASHIESENWEQQQQQQQLLFWQQPRRKYDATPCRPNRIQSETSSLALGSIAEHPAMLASRKSHESADSTPSGPVRILSQTGAMHDSFPLRPIRWESEDEPVPEENAGHSNSTEVHGMGQLHAHASAPEPPVRHFSDPELPKFDPETGHRGSVASGSRSRLTTRGEMPPTQPYRLESQVEDTHMAFGITVLSDNA